MQGRRKFRAWERKIEDRSDFTRRGMPKGGGRCSERGIKGKESG